MHKVESLQISECDVIPMNCSNALLGLESNERKSKVGKKFVSTALNYSKHQTSMLPWGPKSHFLSFSLRTPEKQTHKQN